MTLILKNFYKKIFIGIIVFLLFFPFSQLITLLTFQEFTLKYSNPSSSNGSDDIDLSTFWGYINSTQKNQSLIYKSWYNQSIEMLIIAPDIHYYPHKINFSRVVKPLMEWKNKKGVRTIVLNNFSLYPGIDNPEKIRNMIRSYYETEQIKWVLIVGDGEVDLVPFRFSHNPQSGEFSTRWNKPTDFYYADLTGDWDEDQDNIWGESSFDNSHRIDEINWTPEVYVGRIPASNPRELEIMVNKTLLYETNPFTGSWMNQILLAGGISDTVSQEPPDGEDEARITSHICETFVKDRMNYTHLCRHTEAFTPPEPYELLNSTTFIDNLNEGYSLVFFAGHGSIFELSDREGTIFTNEDALYLTNTDMPFLFYASACSTARVDHIGGVLSDNLLLHNNTGAIGFIGGMRDTYYLVDDDEFETLNRANARLFFQEFFNNRKYQPGRALYDSKVAYVRECGSMSFEPDRTQILTYTLLGDPEIDIFTDIPSSIVNPLPATVYEGQTLTLSIKNVKNQLIPNARVNIQSNDGKYLTRYCDENGTVNFQFPIETEVEYEITISGHNILPFSDKFVILPDDKKPELINSYRIPDIPADIEKLIFLVNATDTDSGIKNIYLLLSNNSFQTYSIHSFLQSTNTTEYNCKVDELEIGEYSYAIILQDYANNYNVIIDDDYNFFVYSPMIIAVIVVSGIGIVVLLGISLYYIRKRYNIGYED